MKIDPKSNFADRIKWSRKHAGMSQKEAARRIGISQPTYSEYETGKSTSSGYTARIAKVFGVDAFWLETGIGDPITSDSSSIVKDFDRLPEHAQKAVRNMLDSLLQSNAQNPK